MFERLFILSPERLISPRQSVVALHPDDSLTTVLHCLSDHSFSVLPVVDGEGRLLGMVDLEEVHLASQSPTLQPLILAADLMQSDVHPLLPENTLDRALELFVENDLPALPVVNDLKTRKMIGIVQRSEVAVAYLRRMHGSPTTTG